MTDRGAAKAFPERTEQDVIETAYVTAALRAVLARCGTVRNPDYLADRFAGAKWQVLLRAPRLFRWYAEKRIPGACYYHLVRTLHFDGLLSTALDELGYEQVVLLGAGYDTRPYRFAHQLRSAQVFEVDLPGTQAVKKQRVQRVFKALPPNVTYVPLNFQQGDLSTALAAAGFRIQDKAVFLWEGVTYFLTQNAVDAVLKLVGQCAVGTRLVFDYALRAYVEGDHSYYGAKEIARELERVGEPHLFGMNANELESTIRRWGMRVVSDVGAQQLEDRYLRDCFGRSVGRPHGFNRIACVEVQAGQQGDACPGSSPRTRGANGLEPTAYSHA